MINRKMRIKKMGTYTSMRSSSRAATSLFLLTDFSGFTHFLAIKKENYYVIMTALKKFTSSR